MILNLPQVVGMATTAPGASPSSSSAATAAPSKIGSAAVFRRLVPLLGPPVLPLRHSAKIICLSTSSSGSSHSPASVRASAAFSEYAATADSSSASFTTGQDGFGGPNVNSSTDGLVIADLGIDTRIVEALAKRNIISLFPIQRAVFEPAMQGRDLIARAKTGTGKTLAFGLPVLDKMTREKNSMQYRPAGTPQTLILAPTRELAKQVENELVMAAPHLSVVCIYGGVSIEGQRRQLQYSVDVVVGTPGRVIDMLQRGDLRLNQVKYVILDEADQMLAVGFAEEVEKIMEQLPSQRQSMLFSATMPSWIRNLSRKYLTNPLVIDLVGENEDKIAEGIKLYAIATSEIAKGKILADLLTVHAKGGKAIVFTKTKRDTDDVAAVMSRTIGCEALHGDISQYQREKTLTGFRDGRFNVLVATDVAARGLDIPNVDLIIHYEVPNDSETFVHRSGRTGRAGKKGTCILMYTFPQRRIMRTIENEVGCKFEALGPPTVEDVLASSAHHAIDSIKNVHPDLAKLFLPSAEKLLEELGPTALAAAMAQVSGVSQIPPKRSLLTHDEGYITLQLTGRGMTNASAVSSAIMQLYSKAGERMGKVFVISDPNVEGGVFDLPEDIAKELVSLQISSENVLSAPKVLPDLQEEYVEPYGRFSGRGGFRSSYGGGGSYGRPTYGAPGYGARGGSYGGTGSTYGGSYDRTGSAYGGGGGSYGSYGPSTGGGTYNRGGSYDRPGPAYGGGGGGYGSYGSSTGSTYGAGGTSPNSGGMGMGSTYGARGNSYNREGTGSTYGAGNTGVSGSNYGARGTSNTSGGPGSPYSSGSNYGAGPGGTSNNSGRIESTFGNGSIESAQGTGSPGSTYRPGVTPYNSGSIGSTYGAGGISNTSGGNGGGIEPTYGNDTQYSSGSIGSTAGGRGRYLGPSTPYSSGAGKTWERPSSADTANTARGSSAANNWTSPNADVWVNPNASSSDKANFIYSSRGGSSFSKGGGKTWPNPNATSTDRENFVSGGGSSFSRGGGNTSASSANLSYSGDGSTWPNPNASSNGDASSSIGSYTTDSPNSPPYSAAGFPSSNTWSKPTSTQTYQNSGSGTTGSSPAGISSSNTWSKPTSTQTYQNPGIGSAGYSASTDSWPTSNVDQGTSSSNANVYGGSTYSGTVDDGWKKRQAWPNPGEDTSGSSQYSGDGV